MHLTQVYTILTCEYMYVIQPGDSTIFECVSCFQDMEKATACRNQCEISRRGRYEVPIKLLILWFTPFGTVLVLYMDFEVGKEHS